MQAGTRNPLYDAMCGSGTFTLEAALWADGFPVNGTAANCLHGLARFDEDEWWSVRDALKEACESVNT